jgi:anti-sigma regulatory factor (Ser/Thr protein kinase)
MFSTFVHPAFLYRGDDEYLAGLVSFVEDGLHRGEPVAAALPTDRLAVLRNGLGRSAGRVHLIDMTEAGRNPGRIIPMVLLAFADRHAGQRCWIIGEPIWPTRTGTEYPACVQHEALINAAFAGRDTTILCPYDLDGLHAQAVADAYETHPVMWDAAGERISERYDPDAVIARYNEPLASATDAAELTVRTARELSGARRFAAEHGRRRGLSADQAADLELVVSELATNSLVHAGSHCRLSIWRDGAHVVCAAADDGWLTDPLAGRRMPRPDQPNGRGLLLVNQLADLVRVHTGPAGTTIQARLVVAPARRVRH